MKLCQSRSIPANKANDYYTPNTVCHVCPILVLILIDILMILIENRVARIEKLWLIEFYIDSLIHWQTFDLFASLVSCIYKKSVDVLNKGSLDFKSNIVQSTRYY